VPDRNVFSFLTPIVEERHAVSPRQRAERDCSENNLAVRVGVVVIRLVITRVSDRLRYPYIGIDYGLDTASLLNSLTLLRHHATVHWKDVTCYKCRSRAR
jgi:hypothetical protein